MDLTPVISTAVGAAIALGGTILAHALRSRDERGRDHRVARRQSYLDFVLALDATHGRLRQLADPNANAADLRQETSRAMGENRAYEAREKLLMSANPAVITAGERAFLALGALRKAVRDGAKLPSAEYHAPYHAYNSALWELRRIIREDLGARGLTPGDLDKQGWDGREECERCRANAMAAT